MAKVSGGKSVSAVNRISAGELKGYGTIAGTRRAENPRLIDVSLIIEKPAVVVAQEKLRANGEFQLTRAQEIQRQRHGYLALEMTGAERFDFGVPDDFVRSVQAFRNSP